MKYLMLLPLILIVGCANKPTHENNDLIQWFTEYKSFYGTKTEDIFFNPLLWGSINKARLNRDKSAFVGALSKFPNEIIEITDYKESINKESGCLLVSGTNSNNISLDYYLTYRLEENRWIIDDVTVKYFLDGAERFLKKSVCDEQERTRLWFQFMEQKK